MLLKELCDKYDIKVADMANCIGLSISTLRNNASKTDTIKLSVQQIKAIHDTFDIKYNDIIGEPIFDPTNIGMCNISFAPDLNIALLDDIKNIIDKYYNITI